MSLANNTIIFPKEKCLKFKRISKLPSYLSNALASRTHIVPFLIPDISKKATFQLSSKRSASVADFSVFLWITLGGTPYLVMMDRMPLERELKEVLQGKSLAELPDDLALASIITAFNPLLNVIEREMRSDLRVIKYATQYQGNIEKLPKLFFSLAIERDVSVEITLLMKKDKILDVINILKKVSPSSNISLEKIRTPVYFEQGYSVISKPILFSIVEGDILLIDSPRPINRDDLVVRCVTGKRFKAVKSNNTLNYSLQEEAYMENNGKKQKIDINQIPLTITFDVGEKLLSLQELQEVGPGYTLDIGKVPNDLVTLRIDNMIFGKGEIVDIGGRLGVRVTAMSGESRQSPLND